MSLLLIFAAACLLAGHASAQHIIAHRGASHEAPENTLAAFNLAWEHGADGIEGDFHLTADGQIVCLHDYDTQRVAGERLIVAESTLAELRKLDVGAWKDERYLGERVPTLAEVIATTPEGKLFFLEVKCGPEIAGPLQEALSKAPIKAAQIVVISFDADVIKAVEALPTDYQTQILTSISERDGAWTPTRRALAGELVKGAGADGLGCKAVPEHFNGLVTCVLNRTGIKWGVWTVNNADLARLYRDLGAWSITTDRPGWLREQLSTKTPYQ